MPVVETGGPLVWDNYHGTATSSLHKRFALRSGPAPIGRDNLREAAGAVQAWLVEAKAAGMTVRPVGSGWSPSGVNCCESGWMLNTRRFNRTFRVAPADVMPGIASEGLMLAQAGVLVDEINDRFENDMGRALRTTGASCGQTIAGASATGTHGSVTNFGGIQDQLRAIQIVTPSGAWWIEPAAGVMSDAFIAATGSLALRDDTAFAAAQVNVGALGVVTAVVIESVPRYLVRPIQCLRRVDQRALDWMSDGEFRRFSAAYALDRDPLFVQMIVNPYKPFARKAMLRFLYREEWRDDYPQGTAAQLGAGYDSLSMLGKLLNDFPWARGWLLQQAMRASYASGPDVNDPPVMGSWGQTTETHRPLANLFNASVTIARADLPRVFELICDVFARHGGSTVVTLRFMEKAAGLLAPARFAHNAVIDFDGPRSPRTSDAYARVVDALHKDGLSFTRHWAKSCALDAARVAHDLGDDLVAWKAVRDRLLPTEVDRRLFASKILDHLGLTV